MTDKELLEEIHYNEKNPTRAAELFKKISRVKKELPTKVEKAKVKKELDEIYVSIKSLVQNQYEL